MHRTEGSYNATNLFQNGPPGTRLEKEWLNAVQEELAHVIESSGLALKTAGTETRDQLRLALDLLIGEVYFKDRAKFSWKDDDEIYIAPGGYYHRGTGNQMVYWSEQLVFQFGSGGSNPDSTVLATNTWYYVYLDDSSIVSAATNIITASQLVAVDTAPVWSNSKRGWYNGDDLCIFAAKTRQLWPLIMEFFHDSDFVIFADETLNMNTVDIDMTWTDVALTMPSFATIGLIDIGTLYVDGVSTSFWRTNGQTGFVAHTVAHASTGSTLNVNFLMVITDENQMIEVKNLMPNGNTISIRTHGWGFPLGM